MAYRALIFALGLLASFSASAVYITAQPPANYRPPSGYPDGYGRIIIQATAGGNPNPNAGPALYIGPNSPLARPILVQNNQPYDNQLANFLYTLSPGRDAQAFVPGAVYGAGALVNTTINVGARSIVVPAFMKFAPTAGAAAARQGFKGAGANLFAAMITAAGLGWMWDSMDKSWKKKAPGSDGPFGQVEYSIDANYATQPYRRWFSSGSSACNAWFGYVSGIPDPEYRYTYVGVGSGTKCQYDMFRKSNGTKVATVEKTIMSRNVQTCPQGWYNTPAGCSQTPSMQPVPQTEFETEVAPMPWPDELPEQLPDGVPVLDPVINPLPSPWDPSQPYKEPVGDPVPNPNYDPSKQPSTENPPKIQPTIRIKPSPTETDKWRTDVTGKDEPVVGDEPVTNPKTDPTKPPADPASAPTTPEDKAKDRQLSLCEQFPNISACAPLGNAPDKEAVQNREINVQVNPESGFGPETGTCPAPRTLNLHAGPISMPYGLVCDLANGIRPLIVAGAFLAAAMMVVGVGRKS